MATSAIGTPARNATSITATAAMVLIISAWCSAPRSSRASAGSAGGSRRRYTSHMTSSVADRGAVAPRIGPAHQDAAARVDGDAVGVAGQLVPGLPAIDRVAPVGQLRDGGLGESALQVELVPRVADREAPREPARGLDRTLDVEPEVDQRGVHLEMDLRLAVRAHAAHDLPQAAVAEGERGDQGVQRPLAGLEPVRVLRIQREVGAPILEHDARIGAPTSRWIR